MKLIGGKIVLLVACILGPLAATPAAVSTPAEALSDEEMTQVVTAMLEAAYALPDTFPVGGFVYVSERSLSDQWVVNPIAGFTVRILTLEEIDKHSEDDFSYLEFGRFSRTADGVKASVTIHGTGQDGHWRSCEETYLCKKINGKWEFAGKEALIGHSCNPRR